MIRRIHRRLLCTNAKSTIDSINSMLDRPLGWKTNEQLALMASDQGVHGSAGQLQWSPPEEGNMVAHHGLASWGEFFVRRCGMDADSPATQNRHLLSTLSAAFSCALTIRSALEKPSLGLSPKIQPALAGDAMEENPPQPLRIHIIGAADSHEEALLRAGYFGELSELLPGCPQPIQLHFIGPDLTVVVPEPGTPVDTVGRMNAVLTQSMWEDAVLKKCVTEADMVETASTAEWAVAPPDLAVAFNSGCGVDKDMWANVLLTLRMQQVPLLLTSMDTKDLALDVNFLQGMGSTFLEKPAPNPFGSRLLETRHNEDNRVIQSNAYWSIVM
jgi:hypothetical protein